MKRAIAIAALALAACSGEVAGGSSTSSSGTGTVGGSSASSSASSTSSSSSSSSASSSSSSSSSSASSSSGSTSSSSSASSSSGSSSSSSSSSASSSSSSGSTGSTGGDADAGLYTYTRGTTHWCRVGYGDGGYVTLTDTDAGCEPALPACAGTPLLADPGIHVTEPEHVAYAEDPPASGPHWPCWAPWDQTHAHVVLPTERWMHNAEHTGVVLLYRCDPDAGLDDGGSCDALADPLIAYAVDGGPRVPGAGDMRYLVTAHPSMPSTYAAIAWGWRLELDTFDAEALTCFANAHLGGGYENLSAFPDPESCPQSYAP